MSGETQRQDDASEGDGRAWTPPPPHDAAATGLALTAWVLTPEDSYAAALAS